MSSKCPHSRRRTVAEDDVTTYVECLDCGRFFEQAELEAATPGAAEFDESLADA